MTLNYNEAYERLASKNEWQLDTYQLGIHSMLFYLIEKIEDLEHENKILHNRVEELSTIKNNILEPIPAINPLKVAAKKDTLNDRSNSGGNEKT